MVECFKFEIFWRGITHDLSKLLPSEFIPYTKHFHGIEVREPLDEFYNFYMAWLHHIHRNKHHWQYWILNGSNGEIINITEMPNKYALEMVADWVGAGKAIKGRNVGGYDEVRKWYNMNKEKIILHPNTREYIEYLIK